MKTRSGSARKKMARDALQALRRAGKKAVELGRRMGTPAYVLENGKVVDIARRTANTAKKNRRGRPR